MDKAFLTWLAVDRKVAPSTQNQALQAILFLYRKVLNVELAWMDNVVRAKIRRHIPVVLSRGEVAAVLAGLGSVRDRKQPFIILELMAR